MSHENHLRKCFARNVITGIVIFVLFLFICNTANSEVQLRPSSILSKASSIGLVLEDDLQKSVIIYQNGVWRNQDIIKTRLMDARRMVFRFSARDLPHLVQIHKGNVIFFHEQGRIVYEITIPFAEFLKKIFPKYHSEN